MPVRRLPVRAGLLFVVLALVLPSVALAAGGSSPLSSNPLTPGIPPSQTTTPSTTTPTILNTSTTSSGGGSLSGSGAIVIAIAALALIAGISFFIWRDARRRAPVRHAVAGAGSQGSRPGSKRQTKPRKLSPQERRRRKRGRARR